MSNNINFLSIVVPVYNEESVIEHFHKLLHDTLEGLNLPKYEIIYIDDGSSDSTAQKIATISANNTNVWSIELTRNFGKEAALSAGLHSVNGDCIVTIDADGQHPTHKIADLLSEYRNGFEMVVGLRNINPDEKSVKKLGNKFYYLLARMSGASYLQPRVTDFRAMSRDAVDNFCILSERRRITRGLLDWMGYPTKFIEFKSPERLAGTASYSTKKLAILALDSLLSSSRKPLYASILFGAFLTSVSFLALVLAVFEKYVLDDQYGLNITGTAILGLFTLFMVGLIFISQGILAVYLARTYEEVQQRPLYIIRRSKSKFNSK